MKFARRDLILGAAGSLIAATSGQARAAGDDEDENDVSSYALMNRPAPDFSAYRFGGGVSTLSEYQGRVLILTFGGLWCPACVASGPNVDRLAALAAADADIDYLYLQCGPEMGLWTQHGGRRPRVEDAENAWRIYFVENHLDYPVAFDLSRRRDIARSFQVRVFPTTVVIDRDGVIGAAHGGLSERAGRDLFRWAREFAARDANAV